MKGSDDEIVHLEKKCKRELENIYSVVNIDNVLKMHGLFRLKNFAFAVGDCLFNALQVLLAIAYSMHCKCCWILDTQQQKLERVL